MHFFYSPHNRKAKKHVIDFVIYPIGFMAPLMTLPQLWQIWVNKKIAGVSLTTWFVYAIGSLLWILYGVYHREKVIILVNFCLLVIDSSIVLGLILIHS